jgi:hypothetical protein
MLDRCGGFVRRDGVTYRNGDKAGAGESAQWAATCLLERRHGIRGGMDLGQTPAT